jgi:hypothetical protein
LKLAKATLNRVAFSCPKLLQILPKAVRTRTNKGSLKGQVIFKNNVTFFILYLWFANTLELYKNLFYEKVTLYFIIQVIICVRSNPQYRRTKPLDFIRNGLEYDWIYVF